MTAHVNSSGLLFRLCLRAFINRKTQVVVPRRTWRLRSTIARMNSGARDVSIDLTPQEEDLFDILTKTLEHEKLDTVLRCAGGWVRDKLLRKDSHDIDIAIDNKMGQEFAEHINRYLSSQDLKTGKVPPSFRNLPYWSVSCSACLASLT